MTQLKMLSADDTIAEIRRLYFETSKQTVESDLAKALDLLRSMASEDERERATVFMEGLAEMRNDWLRERAKPAGGSAKRRPKASPSAKQSRAQAQPGSQRPEGHARHTKRGNQRPQPVATPSQPRNDRVRQTKREEPNR